MHLWIGCMVIRASRDQRTFDYFPGLIAVFHALHRLLAPRHPPHALSSLAALIDASIRGRPLINDLDHVHATWPCSPHSRGRLANAFTLARLALCNEYD